MVDNKHKLVLFIAILIIAFTVITYLKNLNVNEEKSPDSFRVTVKKPIACEESCNNNRECLKSCYTIKMNQAIATNDFSVCDKIPDSTLKETCRDNLNFNSAQISKDISKCDLILNINVKETCRDILK